MMYFNYTPTINFVIFRAFVNKYYTSVKKTNPTIPLLIRESSGIQPMIYVRQGSEFII